MTGLITIWVCLAFNDISSVTMRIVGQGIINKKFIRTLGVDGLNRGLVLGVDIDMTHVQVRIRSLDLMEGVVKTLSK